HYRLAPMTIATSLQEKKLQDYVESDAIRVVSGTTARRFVYSVYICFVTASAVILYLFPSTVVITGFIILQLLLLASLYPLIKFAIKTEDHELIWDQDGLHWFHPNDAIQVNEYCEQPYREMPAPANFHMSYAFI
uniref:Hybrid sensor histidine kinase/response regulator n=1 Tax=Haemonchus contortus TaxID=6289 RepID=A0A7I4XXL7_HAECO